MKKVHTPSLLRVFSLIRLSNETSTTVRLHIYPGKRTVDDVDDDDSVFLDIDGWQAMVKDNEDLEFLRMALEDVKPVEVDNVNDWACKQKQLKLLTQQVKGLAPTLGGFIPNLSGSTRTEGVRKLTKSEKFIYKLRRIKLQEKKAGHMQPRGSRNNSRRFEEDHRARKRKLAGSEEHAIHVNPLMKREKETFVRESLIHGWGLFADEGIKQGDFIVEYIGKKRPNKNADFCEAYYQKVGINSSYLFRLDEDTVIDATRMGGKARFINHSCTPNCKAKIIEVEGSKRILIYALRGIKKGKSEDTVLKKQQSSADNLTGEEITYDYRFERETGGVNRDLCVCGTEGCKGFLN